VLLRFHEQLVVKPVQQLLPEQLEQVQRVLLEQLVMQLVQVQLVPPLFVVL
jgi:hypothetical protein